MREVQEDRFCTVCRVFRGSQGPCKGPEPFSAGQTVLVIFEILSLPAVERVRAVRSHGCSVLKQCAEARLRLPSCIVNAVRVPLPVILSHRRFPLLLLPYLEGTIQRACRGASALLRGPRTVHLYWIYYTVAPLPDVRLRGSPVQYHTALRSPAIQANHKTQARPHRCHGRGRRRKQQASKKQASKLTAHIRNEQASNRQTASEGGGGGAGA